MDPMDVIVTITNLRSRELGQVYTLCNNRTRHYKMCIAGTYDL